MSKHILSVNSILNEDSNQPTNLLLPISRVSKLTSTARLLDPGEESENCDHRQYGTNTDGNKGVKRQCWALTNIELPHYCYVNVQNAMLHLQHPQDFCKHLQPSHKIKCIKSSFPIKKILKTNTYR